MKKVTGILFLLVAFAGFTMQLSVAKQNISGKSIHPKIEKTHSDGTCSSGSSYVEPIELEEDDHFEFGYNGLITSFCWLSPSQLVQQGIEVFPCQHRCFHEHTSRFLLVRSVRI